MEVTVFLEIPDSQDEMSDHRIYEKSIHVPCVPRIGESLSIETDGGDYSGFTVQEVNHIVAGGNVCEIVVYARIDYTDDGESLVKDGWECNSDLASPHSQSPDPATTAPHDQGE